VLAAQASANFSGASPPERTYLERGVDNSEEQEAFASISILALNSQLLLSLPTRTGATMNRYLSFGGIAIVCALIVAVSATTAHSQKNSRYDYHNHHKPWGKYGPTISYPSPTKIANVLNGRPANSNSRRVAQRTTPSRANQSRTARSNDQNLKTTRLNDLNLSVTMPSGPWVTSDPREISSRARYLISRDDPTILISLAGERVGPLAHDTNSSLLAESQAKMKSLPGGQIEPGDRLLSAGSIDGIAYAATASDGTLTTYYAIWVAAHNGYNYKLAVYGDEQNKPAIEAALRNFVRGIKPLQTTSVARGNGNTRR
jgi:hypothetical protein